MMTNSGRVINIVGAMAQVRIEPASACSSCGTKSSCASGQTRAVWVEAPEGVSPGDMLKISMPERAFNAAALIGYLLPAAAMLVGAGITAGAGDAAAAAGALAGLGLGMVLVRILGRRAAMADFCATSTTQQSNLTGDF